MLVKPIFKFTWQTLLGILSFGILVPTIFIPVELGSFMHLMTCLIAIFITFTVWEGAKYAQRIVSLNVPMEENMAKHLFFEIFYIFLITTIALTVGLVIYDYFFDSIDITFGIFLRNLIVGFLLAMLFTAINEGNYVLEQWKLSLIEQERLKQENLQSRLESLIKQLDPHFLFNSLSVLSELVYESPKVADEFIGKLSKVYRYVLSQKDRALVKLEDEMNFVDNYLFLMNIRFDNKINIVKTMPKDLYRYWLPPLSIQLLIENAIKHNKISPNNPLNITMTCDENYFEVTNNFNPRSDAVPSTKIGLKNLQDRYELLKIGEIIIQNTENTFTVKLPIVLS